MSAVSLRDELEQELTWRVNELRLLTNLLASIPDEEGKRIYRKSLVVMLYAHFEGYCVFSLTAYLRFVNRAGVACSDLAPPLAASSLKGHFDALSGGGRRGLPDGIPAEEKLVALHRRVVFLLETPKLLSSPAAELSDDLVDSESNLKPDVIRKNLFRLGLDHRLMDAHTGAINQLLQRRNDVAHGSRSDGLDAGAYEKLERMVSVACDALRLAILKAAEGQSFRSSAAATQAA